MYISAYQEGLGARNRMTIGGLLVFVVILVTITAAFAVALVHHKSQDKRIHNYLNSNVKGLILATQLDKRIDSGHQIGYL